MEKLCPQCTTIKPISDFGKSSYRAGGLRAVCKLCNNAKAREWGKANPERALALARKWAAANPERAKEIKAANYRRNKDRYMTIAKERHAADPAIAIERARKWAIKNPSKVKAASAKYRDRNHDRLAESNREYRAKNLERVHQNEKKWRQANKSAVRAADRRREMAELQASPRWLTAIGRAQIEEFYEIAAARTAQTGEQHHVDHIHPVRGKNFRGLHVPWNLQVLTAAENLVKSAKLLDASVAFPGA